MPVLMCCAKEDRSRVEPLIEALRRDRRRVDVVGVSERQGALPGRARMHVDMHTAVIVVWTRTSIHRVQLSEAAKAARTRGSLVPVLLDAVQPPDAHELPMPVDAIGWGGDPAAAALSQIRARIAAKEEAVVDVPAPHGLPSPDADALPALPVGVPSPRMTGRPEDGWRGTAPDRLRRPAGPPPPLRRPYGDDPPTDPDGSSYRSWDPATDIPEAVRAAQPLPEPTPEPRSGSGAAWVLVACVGMVALMGWILTSDERGSAAGTLIDPVPPAADTDVELATDALPDDAEVVTEAGEGSASALDPVAPTDAVQAPAPEGPTDAEPTDVEPAQVEPVAAAVVEPPPPPDPVTDRYVSAGWLAVQQGRSADAASLFQRALERAPTSATALHGIAVAELALGKSEAALTHLCGAHLHATPEQRVELDTLLAMHALTCEPAATEAEP